MNKQRSLGITVWGYSLVCLGIIYGIINAARNIWTIAYVGLPILFVVVGIGILNLKNWARWILVIFMTLLILSGFLAFPIYLKSINGLSKEGLLLPACIVFVLRFVISIGGIIFFIQPSIKEQFKEGGK